ncbi:hypothetical protein ACSHWB_38350 [Lentzea sp. HUAS TT2]|uniref:hypothetical protein n=1 Tax=Lentzea sp. HUAS TT2 TaxID=3447454 RepID=UPI003F70DB25
MIVFPAHEGWRAGLVAADVVVGDDGSVTFYGTALGRPALLGEAPHDTVDPDSEVGKFLAAAPRLRSGQRLRLQVDAALTTTRTTELRNAAELATSVPLKSHSLLRNEFYRLLDLEEPEAPAAALDLPARRSTPTLPARSPCGSQSVRVALDRQNDVLRVTVVRLPADLRGSLDRNAHLVVTTDEPSETALQLADVVVHEGEGDAFAWITHMLAALPGAAVAAGPVGRTGWFAGTRDGHTVLFDQVDGFGPALASVVLAWTSAGHRPCDLPERIDLHLGPARHSVSPKVTGRTCGCSRPAY